MMTSTSLIALVLFACAVFHQGEAFTTRSTPRASVRLEASRREFLDAAMSTTAGLVMTSFSPIANAEEEIVDDLAMPSEEEQKKAEADAMAERLRKKAELQKAKSSPMNFKDSLAKEKEKQKGLQMSKEERRNALCEELGRGC